MAELRGATSGVGGRPELAERVVHEAGRPGRGVLWMADRDLHLPLDLQLLWQENGGGELFESETILSPHGDPALGDDIDGLNRFHWERGLLATYLVLHVGAFGLSEVRIPDQVYVLLSENTYEELAEFLDLENWYLATVRSEYAHRYGLDHALKTD